MTNKIMKWLMIFSLVYQTIFIFIYGSDNLVKFNSTVADIFWISAGLIGMIFGLGTLPLYKKVTKGTIELSVSTFFVGVMLLVLYIFASFITSM